MSTAAVFIEWKKQPCIFCPLWFHVESDLPRTSKRLEKPVAEFIVPDWVDKVDSGIGLSYRPASLVPARQPRTGPPASVRPASLVPAASLCSPAGRYNSQQPYAGVNFIPLVRESEFGCCLSFSKHEFFLLILGTIPNIPNPELRGFGSGSLCTVQAKLTGWLCSGWAGCRVCWGRAGWSPFPGSTPTSGSTSGPPPSGTSTKSGTKICSQKFVKILLTNSINFSAWTLKRENLWLYHISPVFLYLKNFTS